MTDIARLFAEDPLALTKDSAGLEEIIKYYRIARANFNLGEKSAGATKKMKEAGEPKAKVTSLDLDKLLG